MPYTETIDAHLGSKGARSYLIHRNVNDKVVITFPFGWTEHSVYVLRGSLKHAWEKFSNLKVEYGTKFDVVVGYVSAGISFRNGATAVLVSSTSGQVPRLSEVNEELV